MCGIVGVVLKYQGGFFAQTENAFKELLYADALRGEDSTGVIAVEKDNCFHVVKESVNAAWFLPQFDASTVAKDMWQRGKAYIGHNRKTTMGKSTDENAHPFVVNDSFAMVHNGTLRNHKALADTEVDSHALAIHLAGAFNVKDIKHELEDLLPDVNGAYALAMYSQKKHSVYLLRNSERPLTIIETPNAWYWASEGPMLYWVLMRNNYLAKELKLIEVPPDTLFTFDLEKNSMSDEKVIAKKQPIPATTTPSVMAGTTKKVFNNVTKTGVEVSKNEFKRIKRTMIGTRIEWWCEDFVESNFPKSYEEGETEFILMGESDAIKQNHLIKTIYDIKQSNMNPESFGDPLWTGRIDNMDYCARSKQIIISLVDCKPIPFSQTGKQNAQTIPALH